MCNKKARETCPVRENEEIDGRCRADHCMGHRQMLSSLIILTHVQGEYRDRLVFFPLFLACNKIICTSNSCTRESEDGDTNCQGHQGDVTVQRHVDVCACVYSRAGSENQLRVGQ